MNPPITVEQIWNILGQVIDPELGCNIVDLGLVYDAALDGRNVHVRMTLTTPGCPMHESMVEGVRYALLQLDGIDEVAVELVWDPPWTPAMMTEFAREHLGVYEA
jgi:metal-sulfur cluster biosynthetic enzyme